MGGMDGGHRHGLRQRPGDLVEISPIEIEKGIFIQSLMLKNACMAASAKEGALMATAGPCGVKTGLSHGLRLPASRLVASTTADPKHRVAPAARDA